MTLKKGLRSPKQTNALSCPIDMHKLQVWKKIPSTGQNDYILKIASAYDLENRV